MRPRPLRRDTARLEAQLLRGKSAALGLDLLLFGGEKAAGGAGVSGGAHTVAAAFSWRGPDGAGSWGRAQTQRGAGLNTNPSGCSQPADPACEPKAPVLWVTPQEGQSPPSSPGDRAGQAQLSLLLPSCKEGAEKAKCPPHCSAPWPDPPRPPGSALSSPKHLVQAPFHGQPDPRGGKPLRSSPQAGGVRPRLGPHPGG